MSILIADHGLYTKPHAKKLYAHAQLYWKQSCAARHGQASNLGRKGKMFYPRVINDKFWLPTHKNSLVTKNVIKFYKFTEKFYPSASGLIKIQGLKNTEFIYIKKTSLY